MDAPDPRLCVYCRLPLADHGDSPVGPTWRRCPDESRRLVHLDVHFRSPAVLCERCGAAVATSGGGRQ